MKRRDFVRLGCATMIATGAGTLRPAFGESLGLQQVSGSSQHLMVPLESKATGSAANFTLQIAPMLVELAPQVVVSTIGYSNQVPGPLLRVREGQSVTVDVVNNTDVPEYVHWHGLFTPLRSGWGGGRRHAPGPAAWQAQLSIRGQACGFAMVPLAHRSHDGSASGRLHRPVRIFHDRFRE